MNPQTLLAEITKPAYDGMTDAEILAALPQPTNTLGRIQNDDKLDLVTLVIQNRIIDRLTAEAAKDDATLATEKGLDADAAAQYRELALVLKEALDPAIVLTDLYRINLAVADVKVAFDTSTFLGLLTPTEHSKITALATYQTNTEFAGVTVEDIAAARLLMNPIVNQEVIYPAGSVHIIPSPNQKVFVNITVNAGDEIGYADNLVVTAFHKAAGDSEYVEVDQKRGNFVIPANWSGTKAFVINHSNLLPHIKLKITSKYNRVFTATTYTA